VCLFTGLPLDVESNEQGELVYINLTRRFPVVKESARYKLAAQSEEVSNYIDSNLVAGDFWLFLKMTSYHMDLHVTFFT
jgi:hypothetical protein